jgi:hypothetical protein
MIFCGSVKMDTIYVAILAEAITTSSCDFRDCARLVYFGHCTRLSCSP